MQYQYITQECFLQLTEEVKGKMIPLHAMEAHGGRGGIAPTHT
jgi:hypothetical protein